MAESNPTVGGSPGYPRDQILATVYGQATGDAIGLLTEFLTIEEAKKHGNKLELEHKKCCPDGHRTRWKEGDWTDDTDQMVVILQSIIDNVGEVKSANFAAKLKAWAIKGFPELGDTGGLGIGQTTYTVLSHPNYPEKAADIAFEVWDAKNGAIASNGGVMRTSILGVHRYWDTETVARNANDMCQITHHDPRCRASAVAVSVAISLMLRREARHILKDGKYNVHQIIEDSYQMASKFLDTQEQKKMLREHMEIEEIEKLKLDERGNIGYTYKCMGSGFWALKQNDFRKALQKIVMEGGDSDTNGAVAGALLGCKLGMSALPESWVSNLKHKAWLDGKLEEYSKIMARMKDGKPSEGTTKEAPVDTSENATQKAAT